MKKERSFCISMLLGKSTKYQKPKWKQPEKALNKFLMQSSLKFNDRNGYRHIEFLLKEDGSHMEKLGQPSLETSIKRAWKVKVKSLSHFQLFMTIWTVALQPLPSTGLSRQEYWSELPFSSPGDLPDPGIKPRSPTLWADSILAELPGKPQFFNKKNLSSIHVLLATLKTYLHRLLFPKF